MHCLTERTARIELWAFILAVDDLDDMIAVAVVNAVDVTKKFGHGPHQRSSCMNHRRSS